MRTSFDMRSFCTAVSRHGMLDRVGHLFLHWIVAKCLQKFTSSARPNRIVTMQNYFMNSCQDDTCLGACPIFPVAKKSLRDCTIYSIIHLWWVKKEHLNWVENAKSRKLKYLIMIHFRWDLQKLYTIDASGGQTLKIQNSKIPQNIWDIW